MTNKGKRLRFSFFVIDMSDPAGVCKGCDTAFPCLDDKFCGLCLRLNGMTERGDPESLLMTTSKVCTSILAGFTHLIHKFYQT